MSRERRFEFKYILNPIDAMRAESHIQKWMSLDPAAKNGSYAVTSIYFDSPSLLDYYDKSGGFIERKKMRARIYEPHIREETEGVWLELKKKYNMTFVKDRAFILKKEWNELISGNITSFLSYKNPQNDKKVVNQFVWHCLSEGRLPLYFIRYERAPYVLNWSEKLRVTFDKNIEASRQSGLHKPYFAHPVTKDAVIMEVKFATRLPWFINDIIKKLNLRRTSFSKYEKSIDALHNTDPLPV